MLIVVNANEGIYTMDNAMGYEDTHWYDWGGKGELTRFAVDAEVVDHKLVMFRIDLHGLLVNTMALEAL